MALEWMECAYVAYWEPVTIRCMPHESSQEWQLIFKIASRTKPTFALRVGFEPTREDPIWFLVKRLNHSAIAAHFSGGSLKSNFVWHQELYYDLVTGKKARFKLKIDMQDTKYFWCHDDVIFSKLLYLMAKCLLCTIGRVAQWIRRPTSNRKIVGSIPIVVILHISSTAHWNLG